ncbi:PilZ domain-containing protein [Desertibacillus haloalkaliphilus]|uniref:PilZ domain-containing protein n=1 Tax=Desertibacillus haloalkaliphilus TaxID=1328930 RepID=UPI001C27F38C|nr:PilZ domain-containing protein [Desertibacillus haloalkaliphilus]MBU8907991.1 PilZ domain-containing protein [Desertibacillus haloalkaliphilus]
MKYNRQEAYRYEFKSPLSCEYYMLGSNEQKPYKGDIINLSQEGLKMSAGTELTDEQKISLSFTVFSKPITVEASIVWKKKYGDRWVYGIALDADDTLQTEITEEIKQFVKNNQ